MPTKTAVEYHCYSCDDPCIMILAGDDEVIPADLGCTLKNKGSNMPVWEKIRVSEVKFQIVPVLPPSK